MDVTRGDRGSFASRPLIAIMGEAGGWDPRRPWNAGLWPLDGWTCNYRGKETRKKGELA